MLSANLTHSALTDFILFGPALAEFKKKTFNIKVFFAKQTNRPLLYLSDKNQQFKLLKTFLLPYSCMNMYVHLHLHVHITYILGIYLINSTSDLKIFVTRF